MKDIHKIDLIQFTTDKQLNRLELGTLIASRIKSQSEVGDHIWDLITLAGSREDYFKPINHISYLPVREKMPHIHDRYGVIKLVIVPYADVGAYPNIVSTQIQLNTELTLTSNGSLEEKIISAQLYDKKQEDGIGLTPLQTCQYREINSWPFRGFTPYQGYGAVPTAAPDSGMNLLNQFEYLSRYRGDLTGDVRIEYSCKDPHGLFQFMTTSLHSPSIQGAVGQILHALHERVTELNLRNSDQIVYRISIENWRKVQVTATHGNGGSTFFFQELSIK